MIRSQWMSTLAALAIIARPPIQHTNKLMEASRTHASLNFD